MANDENAGNLHNSFQQLLRDVIIPSVDLGKGDRVSCALCYLLVRVANTWRSIRTLRSHSPDDQVFMVDAGTLLRTMYDALIQATYIVSDDKLSNQRADEYLNFEHVERYKNQQRVLSYDNPISRKLKASPHRAEGEQTAKKQFDRVANDYLVERRQSDGTIKRGPGTRSQWYKGNLREIAAACNLEEEYDMVLANFHGCVHSSPFAVHLGPPISAEYVIDWASTIAARVANLSVVHNRIGLSKLHQTILDRLAKPYF